MFGKSPEHKPISYFVRILHRDIGYLLVGMTLVYALSGLTLIYRDTDLLKRAVSVEVALPARLMAEELPRVMAMRQFRVTKSEGANIYFQAANLTQDGVYNSETGGAQYVEKQYPKLMQKMIGLHKINSSNAAHWFAVVYGALLSFMALSSLAMFRVTTKLFRRGLVLTSLGLVAATLVLLSV